MLFSVSRLLCFLTSWVSVMISVHPAAWLSGEATKVLKYSLSFTCFYVLHWQSSSFRHSRTSFSSNWKSGVLASFYLVKTTTAKKSCDCKTLSWSRMMPFLTGNAQGRWLACPQWNVLEELSWPEVTKVNKIKSEATVRMTKSDTLSPFLLTLASFSVSWPTMT